MLDPEKRRALFLLHQEGMGVREISCRLHVSRNTVRSIIAAEGAMPVLERKRKVAIDPELLAQLYVECQGYAERVCEKLAESGIAVKYSTLTRRLRELGLGAAKETRCDRVPDEPGAEMQHDTSSYIVALGGVPTRLVASLVYLRYSKRRYLKFYRRFNRFRMKCFLHEALTRWEYAAPKCVIDNTNLARLRGTGQDAVIVPEMAAFAEQFGFEFLCHEVGHCNRKAGEERSFWIVETNFFPGRTFVSLEDLNEQAFDWSMVRLYHRPMSKTGLIPAKAFEHERAYLVAVPAGLPAPYLVHGRTIDQYGYVAFEANYYWVPGSGRGEVSVLEYGERLKVYRERELLIEYPLPPDGVRNGRFSPEGRPKPRHEPRNRRKPTTDEEKRLRAMAEAVGAYLDFAAAPGGIARHRFIRDVFRLAQETSASLFVRSVERALKYRIRSPETLRRIALLYLTEDSRPLPCAQVDERLVERDAYREGRLTDEPDLSAYDGMLQADEVPSDG
ncbi:MAG: helix-turn-helix domain-containing protein [Candidatus Wallbacteria bacterium]|nr:helix-turn-helix domain-containing protein [Candidatus Wallbacteria bacterium]